MTREDKLFNDIFICMYDKVHLKKLKTTIEQDI